MTTISISNQTAIREVQNAFYQTCNSTILSNRELFILVLGPIIRNRCVTTLVDQILEQGIPFLSTLSEFELSTLFGLDEKQSFHLMAIFEISRRVNRVTLSDIDVIRSPGDVAEFCRDLKYLDKEHFVTVYLNTKSMVIGRETISVGTLDSALVHPREVFKAAIRRGASSVVFAHNHPSTNHEPSPEDIGLTSRLVEAGKIIGIDVLDHIIIGGDGHSSLKTLGLM